MIKAKNGKLTANGHPMELINEYTAITKAMVELLEEDGILKENIREILTNIVEINFWTEEEKIEKIKQLMKEIHCDLSSILDKALGREEKDGADNE